jgi:hypothetical protein
MVLPFHGLAVGLEAVAQVGQEPADGLMTDVVPPFRQGIRQIPGALASPQQRGHGIAAGGGIDQPLQVVKQAGIGLRQRMPAASGATDSPIRGVGLISVEIAGPDLSDPAPDGRSREPGGGGDQRDATIPQGEGLAGGPASSRLLVE